jgi:hypothetical protein
MGTTTPLQDAVDALRAAIVAREQAADKATRLRADFRLADAEKEIADGKVSAAESILLRLARDATAG